MGGFYGTAFSELLRSFVPPEAFRPLTKREQRGARRRARNVNRPGRKRKRWHCSLCRIGIKWTKECPI